MKKIVLFAMCLLSALPAVSLSANGKADAAAAYDDGSPTEVNFLIWWAKKFAEDDGLISAVGERFNAHFTITTIPHNVYFDQINIKIAAGDLPVLYKLQIPGNSGFTQYRDLVEDGQLVSYEELEKRNQIPYLKGYLERKDFDHLRVDDGNIYISPIASGGADSGYYVRKDWMRELGLGNPSTWDEFHKFLIAMKKADPSGKMTAAVGGAGMIDNILDNYVEADGDIIRYKGKWIHRIFHPQFKEGVKFIHRLYAEGLLHPSALDSSFGPNENMKLFIDARVAVLYHNGLPGHWKNIETALLQNEPNGDIGFITPYPGLKGKPPVVGAGAKYYGGNVINTHSTPVQQDKAVQIVNYLFSPEGTDLMFDGVEGVHYTLSPEGKKIPNEELRARDFVGSISNLVDLVDRSVAWDREANAVLKENFINNTKNASQFQVIGLATEEYTDAYSRTSDIITPYLIKFYTGELDIDGNWDRMLDDVRKNGYDVMISEVDKFME